MMTGNSFANEVEALIEYTNNKCFHSHQATWEIVSKVGENGYEISFPKQNWANSLLVIESLNFNLQGIIKDKIFVKEAFKEVQNSSEKKRISILTESAECKRLWLKYKDEDNNLSYPRLSDSEMKEFKSSYEKREKESNKIIKQELEKRRQAELGKIDKVLLKKISKSALEKFKNSECIKTSTWKMDYYDVLSHDPKMLLNQAYLTTEKKTSAASGITRNEPVIEAYTEKSAEFVKKSKNSYQDLPIYLKSDECRKIYHGNPSKKIRKQRKLKKKKESLYE